MAVKRTSIRSWLVPPQIRRLRERLRAIHRVAADTRREVTDAHAALSAQLTQLDARLMALVEQAREANASRSPANRGGVAKLFTSVFDDARLLPHFLHHYSSAGIREFYVAASPEREEEIERLASGYRVRVCCADVSDSYILGQATEAMQQLRKRYQAHDEWVLVADLDEFVSFPDGIDTVIRSAEGEGANVVRGVMFDRFSADGKPVDFEPGADLAAQYPVRSRFIRDVMLGYDHKAVLVKGHLPGVPGGGQHWLVGENVASTVLDIDHYKWTGGSVERLRERCRLLAEAGVDWRVENERVLQHYDTHGRFAWEEFGGELCATDDTAASRCEVVELRLVQEPRGSLSVVEAVPFEIKRVYWVFDVPAGGERARHAHREQHELLIAARGAFTVHCDDGRVRSVHHLNSPAQGLLLPEMVWHHLEDFSEGALCLVLASGPYEKSEYVTDFAEFRQLMHGSR